MKRARHAFPVGLLVSLLFLVGFICWYVWYQGAGTSEQVAKVPRMDIYLQDITIEEVNARSKDIKYYGNEMTLTTENETLSFSDVEFKGRGNSTWGNIKKPYQIKLDEKADLLGLGKARKWVLLANYFDASFLRNDVAFKVAEMLGDENAMRGDFVELYIDENYYGLYYMTHKINIGKEELNLKDALGIVVEIDTMHQDEPGHYSQNGDFVMPKDVVNEDTQALAETEFMTAYNQLEKAAQNRNWELVQKYADVESFARYYLLSELTNNPDAYLSSYYLYKDGPEDKIHAGPGWDYDFALGNYEWTFGYTENFFDAGDIKSLEDYTLLTPMASKLYINLMKIPEFAELVQQIWQEKMAGKSAELLGYICERARYISDAAEHDEARWKYDVFESEVEYLLEYVEQRYAAFDAAYGE